METAKLLDHRVVHAPDGLLDARDLAPDRGDGHWMKGRAGRGVSLGPVAEDRPRPLEFPPGASDPDRLDRDGRASRGRPGPPALPPDARGRAMSNRIAAAAESRADEMLIATLTPDRNGR